MGLNSSCLSLAELMTQIGEAGRRMVELGASAGAAGNISLYIGWEVEPEAHFPQTEPFALPLPLPELAGRGFLVTGSGRRFRELAQAPEANLAFVRIGADGASAQLFSSPQRQFQRPTVEFNSHLAVHRDQVVSRGLDFQAIVHAQPLYLVYLSHIPRYQDTRTLSRQIMRWQLESFAYTPEGFGYLPFLLSGSAELMRVNVEAMRRHQLVLWGKHGVMARSDVSVLSVCDLIEYTEMGARFECLNLTSNEIADGFTADELATISKVFPAEPDIF